METEAVLSPYQVLDLTDDKGLLCGKILADLGARVIKVERPGGDPARIHEPRPQPTFGIFRPHACAL